MKVYDIAKFGYIRLNKNGFKKRKARQRRITFTINKSSLDLFKMYCETHGYKHSMLAECILKDFIKMYGIK
jgi:hypothetical protein